MYIVIRPGALNYFLSSKVSGKKHLSEDVDYVTYHRPLHLAFHGYVWPFIILYILLLGGWVWQYSTWDHMEGLFIGIAIVGALNIITCLFCVWSVHVRCRLTSVKVGRWVCWEGGW